MPLIAGAVITASVGLQAWTLLEVVNLKVNTAELKLQVAGLTARLDQKQHIASNEHYPQDSVTRR